MPRFACDARRRLRDPAVERRVARALYLSAAPGHGQAWEQERGEVRRHYLDLAATAMDAAADPSSP